MHRPSEEAVARLRRESREFVRPDPDCHWPIRATRAPLFEAVRAQAVPGHLKDELAGQIPRKLR